MSTVIMSKELKKVYYASFRGYEIPFRPERSIPFEATERLSSFYIGYHREDGRLVRFLKILLVRQSTDHCRLRERREPGSIVWLAAIPEGSPKCRPGRLVSYSETESMTRFFQGTVEPSGLDVNAELLLREEVFEDQYSYWNGFTLKERRQRRPDGSVTVWRYDQEGQLEQSANDRSPGA